MIALTIFSAVLILGAFAPLTDSDHWVFRGQDYFKQYYLLFALAALGFYVLLDDFSWFNFVMMVLLVALVIYCVLSIIPFTFLGVKKVRKITKDPHKEQLKLMIFNVYQYNEAYQKTLDTIREVNPDVLLLVETCSKWEKALEGLNEVYPYGLKAVQENTYGMMLWSKKQLKSKEIHFIVKKDIPSMEVLMELGGMPLRIFGLHPKPPAPGEAEYATNKDKELIRTGKRLAKLEDKEARLLIGDLNDVAWSKSNMLFKKITGMKDPREGRGFYGTFPTYLPLKIPLDHVFCSEELELIDFEVLGNIGSDHCPVVVSFQV